MRMGRRIAIFLADAGMELCWLFGWAAFLLYAMGYRLAFTAVLGVFGSGCAVSILGRALQRPMAVIALRAAAFIGVYSLLMQSLLTDGFQGWPLAWFGALTDTRRSAQSWLFITLLSILMLGIYWRGVQKPGRPASGKNINDRFDLGLGAFFVLFMVRIVVAAKGAAVPGYPHLPALYVPFFLLSLLAIGLIRTGDGSATYYGSRFHQMLFAGIFALAVLALGASIFGLFHSHLTSGAHRALPTLKSGGEVLVSVLVSVINFLLMLQRRAPGPVDPASDASKAMRITGTGEGPSTGSDVGLFEQAMAFGIGGLALAGTLLLAGVLVWVGGRYLFRRKERTAPSGLGLQRLKRLIHRVRRCLAALGGCILQWLRGRQSGRDLYTALVAWGRRSGIEPLKTDTSLEYSRRLGEAFPDLKREVASIATLVNREVFGEAVLTQADLEPGLAAWRELRKPKHWPLRLKCALFAPRAVSPVSLTVRGDNF